MALSLGSSLATKIYLGATEINLAYFGATQVYTAGGGAFSAEAQNYFDRLDTAGDTTYVDYKQPLANYIDGLVTLGGAYWDDMVSAASFVGVGIQGITVPLRDGMAIATQNNFVSGDLSQTTGLKGNGSTKYIDTGLTGSDLSLNDHSLSVYLTADRETGGNRYISGDAATFTILGNTTGFRARSANTTLSSLGTSTATDELIGFSRNNSADYDWSYETTGTQSGTSSSINNVAINVYADSSGNNKTTARLATYHAGPALNLATLEGLQDTLLAEIAGIGFSTEAANYFSRLANAGDTTFLAYRQPLANYIDSLVALGGAYWDTMLSATSFVGVGIQGVTVPLRAGMTVATNNNFVAADLNQLTGLVGDGSTKYIDTNITGSSFTQNDFSLSAYAVSNLDTGNLLAHGGGSIGASQISADGKSRCQNGTQNSSGFSGLGLCGITRDNSANYDISVSGSTATVVIASTSPAALNQLTVFANYTSNAVALSAARLATYHVGPALDLATLEALQDTLITEVAAVAAAVEIAAFAAESGATDLTVLTNLVTYLKQESLYDNFVIYPMKSAQNAGSGSTVYSLGGITTNDMTLDNSPTWGASGLAFNGTNQAGRVSDYTGSGSVTLFARVSNQTEPASVSGDGVWGQWDSGGNARSAAIFSYGFSQAAGTTQLAALRSANGVSTGLYLEDKVPNWATDSCRVAEWTDGGGRKAWIDKVEETLSLVIGSAQTSRFNSSSDSTFAAHISGGANTGFAALTGIAAASYEGVLTTTQREAITDYINAL